MAGTGRVTPMQDTPRWSQYRDVYMRHICQNTPILRRRAAIHPAVYMTTFGLFYTTISFTFGIEVHRTPRYCLINKTYTGAKQVKMRIRFILAAPRYMLEYLTAGIQTYTRPIPTSMTVLVTVHKFNWPVTPPACYPPMIQQCRLLLALRHQCIREKCSTGWESLLKPQR